MIQIAFFVSDDEKHSHYRVEKADGEELGLRFFSLFKGIVSRAVPNGVVCAIGPRFEAVSSWSSNFCSILTECGILGVTRVEHYRCYREDQTDFDELTQTKITFCASSSVFMQPQAPLQDGMIPIAQLAQYSTRNGLGMDAADIAFYTALFRDELRRDPTKAEIHDLANCNSEHSRHHIFRARYTVPVVSDYGTFDAPYPHTMMELIQLPLHRASSSASVVAFSDNSSAIKGWESVVLLPLQAGPGCMQPKRVMMHHTFTAETHNFPTAIAPFQGATTGTGGRIRDNQAIGRGGLFVAGTCGYCVGAFEPKTLKVDGSRFDRWSPVQILLQASDGTSDYGNKIGEPVIQGFTRSAGVTLADGRRIEWLKPILFTGGLGKIVANQTQKCVVDSGYLIARVGGPTYRLGINGGAASSATENESELATENDWKLRAAVQRGDAQLENRMDRWVRACIAEAIRCERPVICSIHDQGAGGMGNVTKEIVGDMGALIDLSEVTLGDETLSNVEIWTAEAQEQNTVLVRPGDAELLHAIAKRERVDFKVVGRTQDSGQIKVFSRNFDGFVVNLPLRCITPPQKTYRLPALIEPIYPRLQRRPMILSSLSLQICDILCRLDVGSKRFLTNKVDRSVGGLIVQQQTVGPLQTPLADVAVVAHSFTGFVGAATAIGERPLIALDSVERSVRMAIGEMLTNLVWAPITAFEDIRCSGNWMWPAASPEGKALLLRAVKTVSTTLCALDIAIDGGKDSVSMSAQLSGGMNEANERVDAPPTFVISGYVGCTDIRRVVTPGLKRVGNRLWYIPLSFITPDMRNPPGVEDDLDNPRRAKLVFNALQALIAKTQIASGHDVSDGGIITTLAEMCFASEGNYGCALSTNYAGSDWNVWLSERLGVVIETDCNVEMSGFAQRFLIGYVTSNPSIGLGAQHLPISHLRDAWESTATALENLQVALGLAHTEHQWLCAPSGNPNYSLNVPSDRLKMLTSLDGEPITTTEKCACVLRGEGSNGDREMLSALWMAGWTVHDVTTSDLTDGRLSDLSQFQLLVFVGGFTYSDVLGAGTGWAAVLTQNENAARALKAFRERSDTLVLGICNGFQLLVELEWLSGGKLEHNHSARFESRFVHVKCTTNDIWFRDLAEQTMGVWIAHGQGRWVGDGNRSNTCLSYVDWNGNPTEAYPLNPNGSDSGTAAVTSDDGRVLGMMPHPERCVRSWQLPWTPRHIDWSATNYNTYWLLMFRNALDWCESV